MILCGWILGACVFGFDCLTICDAFVWWLLLAVLVDLDYSGFVVWWFGFTALLGVMVWVCIVVLHGCVIMVMVVGGSIWCWMLLFWLCVVNSVVVCLLICMILFISLIGIVRLVGCIAVLV